MKKTLINNKWKLILPDHRAARTDWNEWEAPRLGAISDALTEFIKENKRKPIIFDVGAEEGDFPAVFSLIGADVVLFEPNPRVWPNIRVIWEANKLPKPLGYFVGFASESTNEKPEQIEDIINQPEREGWPECAYGEVIGDHGFRNVSERLHDTPSIKIDDFIETRGIKPDFMTIDVEGSELHVLKGAEKTLRENDLTVFVSIHPEFMFDHYKLYEFDLHSFMKALGYYPTHIAYDHEHHYIFKKQK